MALLSRVVNYLAKELNLDASRAEVIQYGLFSLVFTLAGLVAAVLLSLPFGLLQ